MKLFKEIENPKFGCICQRYDKGYDFQWFLVMYIKPYNHRGSYFSVNDENLEYNLDNDLCITIEE